MFIGSDVFRREAFGEHHPLSIPRQSGVLDVCKMLGWLDDSNHHVCPLASEEELTRFHDANYIGALKVAEAAGRVEPQVRDRYRIGTMENPLFDGLFERAATAVGGSILAARLAMQGEVAFHPAGGTHHGRPDRASGFCYFNDPVFAVQTLLDEGAERVLYLDLDAHHGDGVQDAFADDQRVFTVSIHEANRWPHTGALDDRGGGQSRNMPVPRGFNDSELDYLVREAVLPLRDRFEPQAIVVTCGADGLAGDPLSKLQLSNSGLWNAVERALDHVNHAVVLGGGGYNPWTVVRCWSGLWGRLSGQKIPVGLPPEAQELLAGYECDLIDEEDIEPHWLDTLVDPFNTGPVRDEMARLARSVLE
ncbi:MAG: acetoin utilization protein AcuC [Gammaproteobacteria bacterium]|nr:acetoin utilization protein AcuC [Gammaproteobacteria bacterium]